MLDRSRYPRLIRGLAAFCFLASVSGAHGNQPQEKRGVVWEPVEWTVTAPTTRGNPFDLPATVTFTSEENDDTRQTAMFYKGNDTWAWRFTGTRPGSWSFTTSSEQEPLDGLSGQVTIEENEDDRARGFIRGDGTTWMRQAGRSGRELEPFVPQLVMYEPRPASYHGDLAKIRRDITTFVDEHGFTGFHVPSIGGQWFDIDSSTNHGGTTVSEKMVNPDPETFEALELLINETRRAGGVVHLWAWGDQARGQTPINLPGGINGKRDRRLQRYIAARLGPLPGWTMGYGFDLDEWAGAPDDSSTVEAWARYINRHAGWVHLLGGRPVGPNRGIDHQADAQWNRDLGYASYEHHEPGYQVYVAALTAEVGGKPLNKPVFSEDRFRIRGSDGPGKDYTERQTRRGLWLSTMAGGVANIWGNLTTSGGELAEGGMSLPYRHPHWIKTYDTFFFKHSRFSGELRRSDAVVTSDRAFALAGPGGEPIIVYAEGTSRIGLDLSDYRHSFRATAVDTRQPYRELDAGTVDASADQSWQTPKERTSDWALLLEPMSDAP